MKIGSAFLVVFFIEIRRNLLILITETYGTQEARPREVLGGAVPSWEVTLERR